MNEMQKSRACRFGFVAVMTLAVAWAFVEAVRTDAEMRASEIEMREARMDRIATEARGLAFALDCELNRASRGIRDEDAVRCIKDAADRLQREIEEIGGAK